MLEIRHFRYFLAVAKHAHFTRAAEQLGIATPTLSRQIQDMERIIGTRLFDRNRRSVTLTAAGQALQSEAEQAVGQFEAAQRNAVKAGRGETGHIEMAYVASAAYTGLLQKHVAMFAKENPSVTLTIQEFPMKALPERILGGQLDLGYIRMPMAIPDGIEAIAFSPEKFVLAMPADSWLCRLPEIMSHRLDNETFILPEQIAGTLDVARQGGFTPKLGDQPGSLVAVLTLVSMGQGIAVVPESVVNHIALPNVSYRHITDCAETSYLAMIHRRFEKAPSASRYIQRVREHEGLQRVREHEGLQRVK